MRAPPRPDRPADGLRQRTARGTVINAAFLAGLATLSLVKGFLIAGFLSRSDYGLWGILVLALGTLGLLKQIGIQDKYVQQAEDDQRAAFQKAFTLEALGNLLLTALLLVAVPVLALTYDEPDLVAPGLVLAVALPIGVTFQSPLWVFYRSMDFARQRTLQAVDPVVSFIVAVAMAVAGAGYWSLVIGAAAGSLAAAVASVIASPFPLAFRYERGALREYWSFSWPLLIGAGTAIVMAQLTSYVGEAETGLAGLGAIALASQISTYANKLDEIVTQTLYPAVAAVKDRADLLHEAFVKSNRLALMWGFPFGVAIALFADPLVHDVIGDKWEPAIPLIRAFGLIAAFNHIGFNWTAFFRARGDTRPIGVASVATLVTFVAVPIPLLITDGLEGLAIGMAVLTGVGLLVRGIYLARLFPAFSMLFHSARAMAPTVPAAAVVLALQIGSGAELALYVVVTLAATWLAERTLLREVRGYLSRSSAGARAPG